MVPSRSIAYCCFNLFLGGSGTAFDRMLLKGGECLSHTDIKRYRVAVIKIFFRFSYGKSLIDANSYIDRVELKNTKAVISKKEVQIFDPYYS